MNVRPVCPDDKGALVPLTAQFRVALAQLQGRNLAIELGAAQAELKKYLHKDFPISSSPINSQKTTTSSTAHNGSYVAYECRRT